MKWMREHPRARGLLLAAAAAAVLIAAAPATREGRPPASVRTEAVKNGVRLTLATPQAGRAGQPRIVKVTLRNEGKDLVEYGSLQRPRYVDFQVRMKAELIRLQMASGDVPLTRYGKRIRANVERPLDAHLWTPVKVKPGQESVAYLNLGLLYDLSLPGKYEVSVATIFMRGGDRSKAFTIEATGLKFELDSPRAASQRPRAFGGGLTPGRGGAPPRRPDDASATPPTVLREEQGVLLGVLPNGLALVPDCDNSARSILSFAHGGLQRNPYVDAGKEPESGEAFLETLRKYRTGDLMYDDAEGGCLIAATNMIQSLGKGDLMRLDAASIAKPARKERVPAVVGERYVVETVNGKYAAFRVLAVTGRMISMQWVYQPDGSGNFHPEGTFLDRPLRAIERLHTGNLHTGVMQLKERGVRICFEPFRPGDRPRKAAAISVKAGTVREALDAVVKARPEYRWERVEGTDIICLFPRKGSVLGVVPDIKALGPPVKDRSWLAVIRQLRLPSHSLRFPHAGGGAVDEAPPDKRISLTVGDEEKPSLRTLLARICWEYGCGMTFRVRYSVFADQPGGLSFYTRPAWNELRRPQAALDRRPERGRPHR